MLTPRFILYLGLLLAIVIYGTVQYRKQNSYLRWIWLLVLITLLSESFSRISSYWINSSSPVYHVFAPLQLGIIAVTYFQMIRQKWVLLVSAFIVGGNILNSFFFQPLFEFPSYNIMINGLWIVVLTLYAFFYFLQKPSSVNLYSQSWFWFGAGNLIFYSSSFLFFAFLNFLIEKNQVPEFLYSTLWVIGMILYCFYFIAIFKGTKMIQQSAAHA